jgi:predicted nucleic acid-binding protein
LTALICDTSALLAYFDVAEPDHQAVVGTIDLERGPLVVSPFVVAELDYLVASRLGVEPELRILDEIASGAWDLASFGAAEVRAACDVIARYEDQKIGITDASLVVLAERYGTDRILTLDSRHFGVMRTSEGRPLSVLPG